MDGSAPPAQARPGPTAIICRNVYIFSQGEALRTGVAEGVRRSPLVVAGYFLFSLSLFGIFAPVYWFFLLKNLRRRAALGPHTPQAAG